MNAVVYVIFFGKLIGKPDLDRLQTFALADGTCSLSVLYPVHPAVGLAVYAVLDIAAHLLKLRSLFDRNGLQTLGKSRRSAGQAVIVCGCLPTEALHMGLILHPCRIRRFCLHVTVVRGARRCGSLWLKLYLERSDLLSASRNTGGTVVCGPAHPSGISDLYTIPDIILFRKLPGKAHLDGLHGSVLVRGTGNGSVLHIFQPLVAFFCLFDLRFCTAAHIGRILYIALHAVVVHIDLEGLHADVASVAVFLAPGGIPVSVGVKAGDLSVRRSSDPAVVLHISRALQGRHAVYRIGLLL